MADALSGLVELGRSQGLERWTSEQICCWESVRRGVTAGVKAGDVLTLRAGQPLREATLLLLASGAGSRTVKIDSRPAPRARWSIYGFEFDAVSTDIVGQLGVQVG